MSERAILLENSIIDTDARLELAIPQPLQLEGDPGAYIVQCRGPLDRSFRDYIVGAGGAIVSYIPNNAYLVRASREIGEGLARGSRVQAVLPYEPYYKIKPSLLALILEREPVATAGLGNGLSRVPGKLEVNVLLFPHSVEEVGAALVEQKSAVLARFSSPFGPVLTISCSHDVVPSLARMGGVQLLELSRHPVPAMDLGRAASGITSGNAPFNYLGLSGSNAVIPVLDSGIDATHPDLAGRVILAHSSGGTDPGGHGTHVAGIIAGSGASSLTVTNARGSAHPPVNWQFRGVAPGATLVSIPIAGANGLLSLEDCLQAAAAVTNAAVANSSWHYAADNEYDLAAAICDAAARDALPALSGPQPLLCVFAAGNVGAGTADGTGGVSDTIQSPATAKNVITVGAVEKGRWISNETWTCSSVGGCETNHPWLSLTDASNQVAAFSSRGNVGVGTEGAFGRSKPDLVAQGTFVVSARSASWNQSAYYSTSNNLFTSSPDANYAAVLSNLNDSIGPFYRFESGTSLAAAQVSGALALMREFFARLGRTNSPAAMKALLINGARGVGSYGLGTRSLTNGQGWGQLRLPTSIPAALTNTGATARSMFLFDQEDPASLATGESRTRWVEVKAAARTLPLRATLVWTDPAGHPAAAVKLVNDLDLVVTNLDTGEVFFGNDIPPGSQFSSAWEPNCQPRHDAVNNVEAVILPSPVAGRYSVTVLGRRVNVNAVSSSVTNLVQDYALVISSGDGEVLDALSMDASTDSAAVAPRLTVLTNQLAAISGDFGAVLWHERVGSGSPLQSVNTIPLGPGGVGALAPGIGNQWQFYVLTNSTSWTNAAFVTFLPPPLSASSHPDLADGLPAEADIDLYVSLDPGLTNLDAAVIAAAEKSLGRGGAEWIVLSNASPGLFYIGVKCESQSAAEYGLMAVLSESPFAETDAEGKQALRGFPAPAAIPGPGSSAIMCLSTGPLLTRRAIVTNSVSHPASASLRGILTHGLASAVLNNRSSNVGDGYVYDDSEEANVPGARASDGPGSLEIFAGWQGTGQWLFTMESTNQPGTNQSFWISLEPQQDLAGGLSASILAGGCRREFIPLASAASNLLTMVSVTAGAGPVSVQCFPIDESPDDCVTVLIPGGGSGSLVVDEASSPPIHLGTYVVRLCNLGPDPAEVSLVATTTPDQRPPPIAHWTSTGPALIRDDAVSCSRITVTNLEVVEAVEAGVRIDHPRISDLVLSLISPSGRRVLLQENRGGASVEGMGADSVITTVTNVSWVGGPEAFTNVLEVGQSEGTVKIEYDFFSLADTMHVYYEGALLFDSGLVRDRGITNLSFGPGSATSLTIVMNEGGNSDTNTVWFYQFTSTRLVPVPVTFTENTNFAPVPIKFAPPPLTNFNYSNPGSSSADGIFYLPEQSLDAFIGEPALGDWTLEIRDTRAGATNPVPKLVSWRFDLRLRPALGAPTPLAPGRGYSSLLAPRQVRWFSVDAPLWASFATNRLLFAGLPVNLLFDESAPTGTNSTAVLLLTGCTAGAALLQTNHIPALLPGTRYYLAVQNTNSSTVTFSVQVDFDVDTVRTLENGIPFATESSGAAAVADYYRFVVGSNAVRVQFEVNGPTENVTLFAHKGLPLPGPGLFDYLSAHAWTNDEMVVIYDDTVPVPLTSGEWFLAVMDPVAHPVSYTIRATEFQAYGTNLFITDRVITNGAFCLTWTSLPGVHYFVQGKVSVSDSEWVTISPTITATDVITFHCVPWPSTFQYFRICEGLAVSVPPLLINSVSCSPAGALIRWSAEPGDRFRIEWSPSLASPAWSPFTNNVSSLDGLFQFLDDGSQYGGLGQTRFYRLLNVR